MLNLTNRRVMPWLESVHLISLGLVEGDGRLYDVLIKMKRKRKKGLCVRKMTLNLLQTTYSAYFCTGFQKVSSFVSFPETG